MRKIETKILLTVGEQEIVVGLYDTDRKSTRLNSSHM